MPSRGRLIDMGKYLLGCKEPVEGRREAGVDGHLHEDFGDLVARQSDIQCRFYMHLELRRGCAHGCKRCDGGNLAVAQRQAGARIDISEREFEEIVREFRRDIGKRVDDVLAGLAVDSIERPPSAFQACFVRFGSSLGHQLVSSVLHQRSR